MPKRKLSEMEEEWTEEQIYASQLAGIQSIINGYEIEIQQLKERLEELQRQFEAQKLRKF
jgi:predicted RNase H-like nuclease (RuvC/YqgF family)